MFPLRDVGNRWVSGGNAPRPGLMAFSRVRTDGGKRQKTKTKREL